MAQAVGQNRVPAQADCGIPLLNSTGDLASANKKFHESASGMKYETREIATVYNDRVKDVHVLTGSRGGVVLNRKARKFLSICIPPKLNELRTDST